MAAQPTPFGGWPYQLSDEFLREYDIKPKSHWTRNWVLRTWEMNRDDYRQCLRVAAEKNPALEVLFPLEAS